MGKEQNLYNILKLFCFAIVMIAAVIVIRPSVSCAQNAGCATDTWTAMVNQSVLETRREDLLNKRYIVKSNSVLQYSCFAAEIVNMAANIGPIFSNNPMWEKKDVPLMDGSIITINGWAPAANFSTTLPAGVTATSLEESLSLVVDEALVLYLGNQFAHEVLSSTTPHREPDSLCFNMANIWQAAKCKNFDGTKVFYRFDDIIAFDPREFPPEIPCVL